MTTNTLIFQQKNSGDEIIMRDYITQEDSIEYLNKTFLATVYNYADMGIEFHETVEKEIDDEFDVYMPNYIPIFLFPRMDFVKYNYINNPLLLCNTKDSRLALNSELGNLFSDEHMFEKLQRNKFFPNKDKEENDGFLINKKFVESIEQTNFIKKIKKYCSGNYEKIAERYLCHIFNYVYFVIKNNNSMFKKYEYDFKCAYLMFYRGIAKALIRYYKDLQLDINIGLQSTLPKTEREIDLINQLLNVTAKKDNNYELIEMLEIRLLKLEAHKKWLNTITSTTGQNYSLTLLIIRLIHSLSMFGFMNRADTVYIIANILYAIGIKSDFSASIRARFDAYHEWYEAQGFRDMNLRMAFPDVYELLTSEF